MHEKTGVWDKSETSFKTNQPSVVNREVQLYENTFWCLLSTILVLVSIWKGGHFICRSRTPIWLLLGILSCLIMPVIGIFNILQCHHWKLFLTHHHSLQAHTVNLPALGDQKSSKGTNLGTTSFFFFLITIDIFWIIDQKVSTFE